MLLLVCGGARTRSHSYSFAADEQIVGRPYAAVFTLFSPSFSLASLPPTCYDDFYIDYSYLLLFYTPTSFLPVSPTSTPELAYFSLASRIVSLSSSSFLSGRLSRAPQPKPLEHLFG